MYGVIWPKVRDFHQAQDLASETFVQAYLSLESLKEAEKFGFWLCGIARNLTGKWLARRKRNELSVEQVLSECPWVEGQMQPFLANRPAEPHQIAERSQMNQLLWRCLYALPEISVEILILFYMREMKQSEIAEFLGVSLTAVRNRLSDARKRLKKEMIRMVENTVQNQPLAENFTEQVVAEAMKRGEEYLTAGHWKEAREQFQRAADVREDYAPAYRGLGMAVKGLIEDQLNLPQGVIDRQLLEEAYTELESAYRLGDRNPETVWALANLYHLFQQCEEYVDLLWDFAQTSSDIKAAFEAGYKSLFEMQQRCIADFQRTVKYHQILLQRFSGQVTSADQLDSYLHVRGAYSEIGRAEDWLAQTQCLAEQMGDEMLMAQRFFYISARGVMLQQLERYQEAVKTYEAFIHWIRATDERHPHKQRFIIEIQGEHLLPIYHRLGEREKIEAVLADAAETLQRYHTERDAVLSSLTDESEATQQRLDAIYGQVETYPLGDSVEAIRDWIEQRYFTGMLYATHNLAAGCTRIGEGETAIRLFKRVIEHKERQGRYISGNVYTWLARLVLQFHNDRNASLEYLKQATEDRRWAASGRIKRTFEGEFFDSVRNDPEFLAVVNASVVSE